MEAKKAEPNVPPDCLHQDDQPFPLRARQKIPKDSFSSFKIKNLFEGHFFSLFITSIQAKTNMVTIEKTLTMIVSQNQTIKVRHVLILTDKAIVPETPLARCSTLLRLR